MQQNCFYIGSIFKLHGYKGNLIIYNENDFSFNYNEIKYLFIEIDNILVPFFLERISPNKTKNILIKIEDIDSEEKAKKLLNNDVFFPNKYQPKNIETEEKNNELINFTVTDKNFGILGKISKIDSQTSQKLIYVSNNKHEFCFPYNNHFIKLIEQQKKNIIVEIPKEIIELN